MLSADQQMHYSNRLTLGLQVDKWYPFGGLKTSTNMTMIYLELFGASGLCQLTCNFVVLCGTLGRTSHA